MKYQKSSLLMMTKRRKVDWKQLPDDVLPLVTNKLTELKDFIRWSLVCHSWRSSFIEKLHQNKIHVPHQPPLLLLENESNQDDQSRSFYSITEERFYDIQVPLPHDKICPGSSHGWLITMQEDYQVILINPFMSFNNQITLPCLPDERNLCLHKVVLSANPLLSPSYKAIAIYGRCKKLAFFKPGDTEWTTSKLLTYIHDVICYNHHQILAVNKHGEVFDCDANKRVAPCLKANSCSRYLVESRGELLQVLKYEMHAIDEDEDEDDEEDLFDSKDGFDVYRFSADGFEWIEMKNLEGHVLFVGGSTSLSVSGSEFPKLKSDAIYFTDDNDGDYSGGRWCDMGVFGIVDRINSTHFPNSFGEHIVPIPIWVNPMLYT